MIAKNTIAIVDDEQDILDMLSYNLKSQGYQVFTYNNGEDLILGINNNIDLIILDVMMPKLDGFSTCKKIKSNIETRDIPIIFLTAKDDDFDEVVGLEIGAVDYITKPIKIKKIIARIRVALRNSKSKGINNKDSIINIDSKTRTVLINSKKVYLTRIEFDLLYKLIRNKNQVFSRNELISSIHSDKVVITDRAIDVHIRNIRKKIGKYSNFIITYRGIGYSYSNE